MAKQCGDIDQILEKCGNFGRYQFMLLGFFSLINVLASMHYYSQTIISFVPEHWCYTNITANMTIDELRMFYSNFSNPSCINIDGQDSTLQHVNLLSYENDDSSNWTKHKMSESSSTLLLEQEKQQYYQTDGKGGGGRSNECKKWIYDYDFLYGYRSMTSELNWVCQNNWKSITGQSTYFIGSVVGTLVLGILADFIGRLPVLILAHIFGMIGNFLTIFATNEITFAISRGISGIATDNNFVMMYILVLEYIAPKMRTLGLNLCIGIFYCFGSVVTPWVAVWLGNWKLYLLATIIPTFIVPIFYFIIPESAEWLISKNKLDEALVCYQRIAKFNKRELDENFVENFKSVAATINSKQEKSGEVKNPSLIDLFKTPRLRRLTLILFFKSMIITLGYDAISKNVEGLGISPFVLFSLSACAILPACIVLLLLQDKIGRKAMASSSLFVSAIFVSGCGIILAYHHNQNVILISTLSIIGRFGVTVAYNSGAQYCTELIPTCVRAQGVAAAHVAGYALTFFSSYILYTATFLKAMPSLILGALMFAGAFCCLFLPETLNRKTPITLNDGEEFGRGERFFHFACFDKAKQRSESTMTLS